jgi:hypothetical protein
MRRLQAHLPGGAGRRAISEPESRDPDGRLITSDERSYSMAVPGRLQGIADGRQPWVCQEFLAVAEFARIQIISVARTLASSATAIDCRDFLPHPRPSTYTSPG